MRIEISDQVRKFLLSCPPEPRRLLRDALQKLSGERGDIKALEDELDGYYRLRVRSYRIIFRYETSKGGRRIFCPFLERRSIVYEAFQRTLG